MYAFRICKIQEKTFLKESTQLKNANLVFFAVNVFFCQGCLWNPPRPLLLMSVILYWYPALAENDKSVFKGSHLQRSHETWNTPDLTVLSFIVSAPRLRWLNQLCESTGVFVSVVTCGTSLSGSSHLGRSHRCRTRSSMSPQLWTAWFALSSLFILSSGPWEWGYEESCLVNYDYRWLVYQERFLDINWYIA